MRPLWMGTSIASFALLLVCPVSFGRPNIGKSAPTLPLASAERRGNFREGETKLQNIPTEAKTRVADLELSLKIPGKLVAGEAINVVLTMKNLSTKEVLYGHESDYADFTVRVIDSQGKPARLTVFGETAIGGEMAIKINTRTLPPHGELRHLYNLSRLFDLTVTGTYTLSVVREVNEDTKEKKSLRIENFTFAVSEPGPGEAQK